MSGTSRLGVRPGMDGRLRDGRVERPAELARAAWSDSLGTQG